MPNHSLGTMHPLSLISRQFGEDFVYNPNSLLNIIPDMQWHFHMLNETTSVCQCPNFSVILMILTFFCVCFLHLSNVYLRLSLMYFLLIVSLTSSANSTSTYLAFTLKNLVFFVRFLFVSQLYLLIYAFPFTSNAVTLIDTRFLVICFLYNYLL